MEKSNFWNDAAKFGAILGALLAVSTVVETMLTISGSTSLYMLLILEWIAVVVLHYYLLHRFTRSRSMLFSADEGFTFGQGYSYVLAISGFAGVIVGIVQYLHIYVILGYANYLNKVTDALTGVLAQGGGIPASMETAFAQVLTQLRDTPEPSILNTVGGGIFSGLLFGAVFGLIIAGVLSRAPKPFGPQNNE